ncbi:DsbA family protein [Vibrio sp. ZSDE26]|uniref:DsbA family protein n=1 Tax=Vibrio amylolyticus TaxID=2847292 RepID=A0A9X1XKL2_9VIBR|nr:DsbA family protein [Vibrio amylolyticus]MCK6264161.1 DsbA family protein [Vibrio amylolyticus]
MPTTSKPKLYYVYDPMCSWCWGYKPTWQNIETQVRDHVDIIYVLGGLAPDSDVPMPEEMQQQIASYWKKIENYLGTQFNYEFWSKNTPRRSTYPACRALLAAREQGKELDMLTAIQHAYYLNAQNPSDNDVLEELAHEIGLNQEAFNQALISEKKQQALLSELRFARSIGGNSFPSLFVEKEGKTIELPIDYQNAEQTIQQILK